MPATRRAWIADRDWYGQPSPWRARGKGATTPPMAATAAAMAVGDGEGEKTGMGQSPRVATELPNKKGQPLRERRAPSFCFARLRAFDSRSHRVLRLRQQYHGYSRPPSETRITVSQCPEKSRIGETRLHSQATFLHCNKMVPKGAWQLAFIHNAMGTSRNPVCISPLRLSDAGHAPSACRPPPLRQWRGPSSSQVTTSRRPLDRQRPSAIFSLARTGYVSHI